MSNNPQFDEFWVEIEQERAKQKWLPVEVVCQCFKGAQRIVIIGGKVFKAVMGVDRQVPDQVAESFIHYTQEVTPPLVIKAHRSRSGVPVIIVTPKEQ